MSIRSTVQGFLGAFRSSRGVNPNLRPSDSLANALKESTHVRGGWQGVGFPRAGTEAQHEIVAKGHENYAKSFKKKNA